MTVMLKFKEPSFEALFHLGMDTAVILDEMSAASEATNPIGTGPYTLSSWTKGSSITVDKMDGFRDPSKIAIAHATSRFISDPSAAVAAMLSGDVRRLALRQYSGARPVPRQSALPGAGRRTGGQDDPGDEQQEEAPRRLEGSRRSPTRSTARRLWTAR